MDNILIILNITFHSKNYLNLDSMIHDMLTLAIRYEAVASDFPDLIFFSKLVQMRSFIFSQVIYL